MTDKSSQIEDNASHHLVERLTKLESSVELLDYKLKKEIPSNLPDRIIVLEQKFESETNFIKKELSDAKGTMKERLAFISIIVALIIALASLIIGRV